MLYRFLADTLVVFHFSFILFVVFGGFLALRWPRLVYAHIPAMLWGVLIELSGWICPLTPLENHFRLLSGEQGYQGGYIEHYLIPLIYPVDLTRTLQFIFGGLVIVINLLAYSLFIYRKKLQAGNRH